MWISVENERKNLYLHEEWGVNYMMHIPALITAAKYYVLMPKFSI